MSSVKVAALAFALGAFVLSGCSATYTAINKRHLDVQTKMSNSIFLTPVSQSKRTVFLQVRNTSDKPGLSVEAQLISALQSKGYQIMQDPEQAHYLIQANVLQAGRTNLRSQNEAANGGFGSAVVGGVVGGQFGGGHGSSALAVGGALLGIAADALVQDVHYSIVTDLQISERSGGAIVLEESTAHLAQGTSSTTSSRSVTETDWKRYQTRIVSTANQANLEYVEAEPVLVQGLINSISGIL